MPGSFVSEPELAAKVETARCKNLNVWLCVYMHLCMSSGFENIGRNVLFFS